MRACIMPVFKCTIHAYINQRFHMRSYEAAGSLMWCSHPSSMETVAHSQVRSRQGRHRGKATLYETTSTAWECPSAAYSYLASGWLVRRCWRIPVKTSFAFECFPFRQWNTVCTWRIVADVHTKHLQHHLYRNHGWHWIHSMACSGKSVGQQDTHNPAENKMSDISGMNRVWYWVWYRMWYQIRYDAFFIMCGQVFYL